MSKYYPQPYEDDVDNLYEPSTNRPYIPRLADQKAIENARRRANQRGERRVTTEDFDNRYAADTIPMNQVMPEEENWTRRYSSNPYPDHNRSVRTQKPSHRPMQPVEPETPQRPVRINTDPRRGDKVSRRKLFAYSAFAGVGLSAGMTALVGAFTVVRSVMATEILNRWQQGLTHGTTETVVTGHNDSKQHPTVFHVFVHDNMLYSLETGGTAKKGSYVRQSPLNYDGDPAQITTSIKVVSSTRLLVHAALGNIDVWGNQGHADVEFRFQPSLGCFIPLPQSK